MISIVAVSSYEIDFSLQSYADAFLVIFVAKIDYNAYQAGIKDIFNAQAGATFLQDCDSASNGGFPTRNS